MHNPQCIFTSHKVRALRTSIPTKKIKKYLPGHRNWDGKIFKSIAWEAYASSTPSTDVNMHKLVIEFCNNWLPVGQRLKSKGTPTITVPHVENMNRMILLSVANPAARRESLFFAHSTRK
jgi:hypothetical protein